MNRFPLFIALLATTPLAIAPIKGKEPENSSYLAKELADLKRQVEESNRKIKALEARLNAKTHSGPDDFGTKVSKVNLPKGKVSKGHLPKDTSPQGNLSEGNVSEVSHKWPDRYIPVPNTNSAIQFVANPNLGVSYDFGPFAGDFLAVSTLPLEGIDPNTTRSGRRVNAHARATQFGFRTLSLTNIGEVRSEVNLDFYGTPDPGTTGIPLYQPRLRFAFVELLGFTIGHTTTNFLDLDAIGETVDYGTILGGAFRHGLVKYAFHINKQLSLALAAEHPVTDYTNATASNAGNILMSTSSANKAPDFTAHLRYEGSFGHVALRGVVRELSLKDHSTPVPQSFRKLGWGLGVSAKIFVHKKTNLFAQTNFGNGIGRFIILCNGQSAFYNPTTGLFELQKAVDGIIGLEHFWSDSFRSNIIYGHTFVSVSRHTPVFTGTARVTKSIDHFILNLIYSPIPPLDLGIEYGHASRKTVDFKRGKANRITLGAVYRF